MTSIPNSLKATRNQIGNAGNKYQGDAKRVLTICSAGMLRSPTAAQVLTETYGFNCRAAGMAQDFCLIPVTEMLIYWADEIVFMEQEHFNMFSWIWKDESVAQNIPYKILDIPDNYERNDPTLRTLIIDAYDGKNNLTFAG